MKVRKTEYMGKKTAVQMTNQGVNKPVGYLLVNVGKDKVAVVRYTPGEIKANASFVGTARKKSGLETYTIDSAVSDLLLRARLKACSWTVMAASAGQIAEHLRTKGDDPSLNTPIQAKPESHDELAYFNYITPPKELINMSFANYSRLQHELASARTNPRTRPQDPSASKIIGQRLIDFNKPKQIGIRWPQDPGFNDKKIEINYLALLDLMKLGKK